jgi:hypothetical protein
MSESGKVAVLGVFYQFSEYTEDGLLPQIINHLPNSLAEPQTISNLDLTVMGEFFDFAREDRGFYRYEGSFTTPPCTEGVAWTVASNPVYVSGMDLGLFWGGSYAFFLILVMPKNARYTQGRGEVEDLPTRFVLFIVIRSSGATICPGYLLLIVMMVTWNPYLLCITLYFNWCLCQLLS